MSLDLALSEAIRYADTNGVELTPLLRIRARRVGAIKAGGDVPSISAAYHDAILDALVTYFTSGGSINAPRNAFRRAMVDAFGAAFDLGYDGIPEGEALDWLNARVDQEFAFIDGVFVQAKELRKEDGFDFLTWVAERSDAYTRSVAAVYNAGALFAKKNQMLFWRLGNTEKHCGTCAGLDGQSHRASWYLSRNYIPRQPGAAMLCGGYYCDCKLEDAQGNEVTI